MRQTRCWGWTAGTAGVAEARCRLGADQSFAVAQEHLWEMLGVQVCAETVRTMVERHGKAMQRFQLEDE